MNSDGTNLKELTTTQGYSCDWYPTSEWIVCTVSRAVIGRLWLIRSDGSGNHQLTISNEVILMGQGKKDLLYMPVTR
jgi:Tol biopolymer transport system component